MSRKKYYKIQPQKYQCLTIVIPKNSTSLQMADLQHSYKPTKSLTFRKQGNKTVSLFLLIISYLRLNLLVFSVLGEDVALNDVCYYMLS